MSPPMSSPAFIRRKTSRITGDGPDQRRSSVSSQPATARAAAHTDARKVPHARKPRSRPASSLRDHLPFPQGTLAPSSGPYSVSSMDIEVPAEHPRPISDMTRDGRHLLQLETVLFTLYYPAAFGSGEGFDPGGNKHWSRETWLPRPRRQTARGYARFANIPDWSALAFFGATSMLTKLRGFRNSPPAAHWPPEGNSKQNGYTIKNQQGPPPPGHGPEPVFPLLLFSHGLGGTRTAYSSLCSEFASYGFVVCAVEHRDGSGPRTFVNHSKSNSQSKDSRGGARSDQHDAAQNPDCEEERERWRDVDHSHEDISKGYHHVDYIFPKDNPKDTAPNNERGVDQRLRNAQIELRLCELEEACRVLKLIWAGHGEQVARQNLRGPGYVGGSSRGLRGVKWDLWKHRFHIDMITVAGHSFGAATVVEVLRHTDRFTNVQAGIIYDIWGAPIRPPAEAPEHRIHVPLLGINSEAFMYWQKNFDAIMSLMKEASESGAPAYLLTVRGSVHISQSDFSVLYSGITNFFMKATVHPQRAIDLNISASLEFLRLIAPDTGAGKSIINRCMTDESLLATDLLEEVPDEHRPTDQWIAAKLRVDHELRTRFAAGIQRRFKRNIKGQKSYSTEDEVWMHFKPSAEELESWIKEEGRGEKRVDNEHDVQGREHGGPTEQSAKRTEASLTEAERAATSK